MSKKLTTTEFIEKAKGVHGNKYDYSITNYISSKQKVSIICLAHGEFTQDAAAHIRGDKCPNCAKNIKLNNNSFIERAKIIHGDKYDYSLVHYSGANNKITIICSEHGVFEQRPSSHIYGIGCGKCGGRYSDVDFFIEKANIIHNYKYDYSKVIYNGNRTKVTIICSEHGEFEQTPNNHLAGNCCSKCNESKGERNIRLWLEENNIKYISQYRFNDCRDILPLPFDFYLPELNICIEYDGIQHYKIKEYFGGQEGLKDRQNKDNIKTQYCFDNNIKLIRVRYDEDILIKIKNVGQILKYSY